ncbi:hypothetical protein ACQUZK_09405, partial [Streptococcus pyogenes]|uniref:hypothetical protein n=1 Tax=Streptococcus pyogenes TaxID=1314 RepID=UPI003DA16E04
MQMNLGEILTAIGAVLTGASVVVAVCLYVHSLWREHHALARRASALKSLIARECELNLWSIKRFAETFKTIEAVNGQEGS